MGQTWTWSWWPNCIKNWNSNIINMVSYTREVDWANKFFPKVWKSFLTLCLWFDFQIEFVFALVIIVFYPILAFYLQANHLRGCWAAKEMIAQMKMQPMGEEKIFQAIYLLRELISKICKGLMQLSQLIQKDSYNSVAKNPQTIPFKSIF